MPYLHHASSAAQGLPIAAVERETGLGKDTLRVWEKRYGFPQPVRADSGDRMYPIEQISRLKLISRLLDAGRRPGKVVGLDSTALQSLLEQGPALRKRAPKKSRSAAVTNQAARIQALLASLAQHNLPALRQGLHDAQDQLGLANFVVQLVAPLTAAVGEAWAQGRFEIFEEHLYTEAVTSCLRFANSSLTSKVNKIGPTVLLTTLPKEPHGLGLLMAESMLALEGCNCVSLGTQTPLTDIVMAAKAHQINILALSFSDIHNPALVLASLQELRQLLPSTMQLWVGGSSRALQQKSLTGITVVSHLAALPAVIERYRLEQGSS